MVASAQEDAVEAFITAHNLDERVTKGLRALPVPCQLQVIEQTMDGVRNASAIVWSRIRNQKAAAAQAEQFEAAASVRRQNETQVDTFIQTHGLDERVTKGLRELPMDAQLQIVQQNMDNVRKPSAVIWSRVRAAKAGQSLPGRPAMSGYGDGMGGMAQMTGGMASMTGGMAPVTGIKRGLDGLYTAVQTDPFNQWGMLNPADSPLWSQPMMAELMAQQGTPMPPATMQRLQEPFHMQEAFHTPAMPALSVGSSGVENFIAIHSLDARCAKGIRELAPDKQDAVMQQDLNGVRNPSAVIWSRIRKMQ